MNPKRYKQDIRLQPGETHARGFQSARFQLTVMTQAEVARVLGITHQRVQQIEREALAKVRRALEKEGWTNAG